MTRLKITYNLRIIEYTTLFVLRNDERHSVHPPPPPGGGGGGGWISYQIFKKGGAWHNFNFLEGHWWEKAGDLHEGGGGVQFLHKK